MATKNDDDGQRYNLVKFIQQCPEFSDFLQVRHSFLRFAIIFSVVPLSINIISDLNMQQSDLIFDVLGKHEFATHLIDEHILECYTCFSSNFLPY